MLKNGVGRLGRSPCSRNARLEKALVGRAQLGSSQPPLNRVIVRCSLADRLFEHLEISYTTAPLSKMPTMYCVKLSFSAACKGGRVAADKTNAGKTSK
jgi:hypothetical protein